MVKIGTYNLFEFGNDTPTANSRRGGVIETIRGLDVDVLAVQEIGSRAPLDLDAKARVLDGLAADTGLCCRLRGVQAMAVTEDRRYGTAVLWHPQRVEPVCLVWPGTPGFHRRLAGVVVTIGGRRVVVASYHNRPSGMYGRIDDCLSAAMCLTRGASSEAVLCGDFNDTSAARKEDGTFLDPDWTNQPWNINFVHEAAWRIRDDGKVEMWADRRAAQALELGGLTDVAALVKTPPESTDGHWPDDWSGNRRKVRIYVTDALKQAVCRLETIRTEVTLEASDHLPAVVTLDPDAPAGEVSAVVDQTTPAWLTRGPTTPTSPPTQ